MLKLFENLKNRFTSSSTPKNSEEFTHDLERFFEGMNKLQKQITAYNKAFHDEGTKKFYKLNFPNPDLGGNTSACFKEGYRVETAALSITIYPNHFNKGKFGIHINHMKPMGTQGVNDFNSFAELTGANLQMSDDAKMIVETDYKKLSLKQLQLYVKDMIKAERFDLDSINLDTLS